MTATTQAVAKYTPSNRKPLSHQGKPAAAPSPCSQGCTWSISSPASMLDGTFAPSIVIQKTTASTASIRGNPNVRLVRRRSSVRSKSKPARLRPCMRTAVAIDRAAAKIRSLSASWKSGGSSQRRRRALSRT